MVDQSMKFYLFLCHKFFEPPAGVLDQLIYDNSSIIFNVLKALIVTAYCIPILISYTIQWLCRIIKKKKLQLKSKCIFETMVQFESKGIFELLKYILLDLSLVTIIYK